MKKNGMYLVRVFNTTTGEDKRFGYTSLDMAKAKVERETKANNYAWILPLILLTEAYLGY